MGKFHEVGMECFHKYIELADLVSYLFTIVQWYVKLFPLGMVSEIIGFMSTTTHHI